jgi:hypothetical protein
MHGQKYYIRRIIFNTAFICGLCVLFLASSGCTPLRKKFIRQKKQDGGGEQKFIPVLDPVEYPEKVYSAEEGYKYHYSLWKVWNKDFLQVLEGDGSEKRQRYLLGQSIEQLEKMRNLLTDEKKPVLTVLINELIDVGQGYDRSSAMRSKFSIRSKVERNAKEIRNGFSPKYIFIPQK